MELDVNVSSSIIASQIIGVCRGYAKHFTADVGIVIQGEGTTTITTTTTTITTTTITITTTIITIATTTTVTIITITTTITKTRMNYLKCCCQWVA